MEVIDVCVPECKNGTGCVAQENKEECYLEFCVYREKERKIDRFSLT